MKIGGVGEISSTPHVRDLFSVGEEGCLAQGGDLQNVLNPLQEEATVGEAAIVF